MYIYIYVFMYISGGGLKLAYRMMHLGLRDMCRVVYTVTKSEWDWYTEQTKKNKNPKSALVYNCRQSRGWCSDWHLRKTLQHSLYEPKSLQYCFVGMAHTQEHKKKHAVVVGVILERHCSEMPFNGCEACCPTGHICTIL